VFVIVGSWGGSIDNLNQSSLVLTSVMIVLGLELYFHPFRSSLYDVLEEFTTLTEFVLLLLGLVIIASEDRPSNEFDWVEATALSFIYISLALVGFSVIVDVLALRQVIETRTLTSKTECVLPPSMFNLEMHLHMLPAWLGQAPEESIQRLRTVERIIISTFIKQRSPAEESKFKKWAAIAKSEPAMLSWIMHPLFRERKSAKGEPNLAVSYVNSLHEMQTEVKGGAEITAPFVLTDESRGILLSWLATEQPPDMIAAVKYFFADVARYDEKRRQEMKETLRGRLETWLYASYYDKTTQKEQLHWEQMEKEIKQAKPARRPSALLKVRMSTMAAFDSLQSKTVQAPTLAKAPSLERQKSSEQMDIEEILQQLLAQMSCETIIFATADNSLPAVVVQLGEVATPSEIDGSTKAGTPGATALSTREAVFVDNVLADMRFGENDVNRASLSQLCVPLTEKIVITCINKIRQTTNANTQFIKGDVPVVRLFGSILIHHLKSTGTLTEGAKMVGRRQSCGASSSTCVVTRRASSQQKSVSSIDENV